MRFEELPIFDGELLTLKQFRNKVLINEIVEGSEAYFCGISRLSDVKFDFKYPNWRPMWATHVWYKK